MTPYGQPRLSASIRFTAMTSSAARERRTYRLATYRKIATGNLVCLYAIVLTGATVRLTGSGLGCPDWPSCNGARPVPDLAYHPMIEFINRTVSVPTMVFAVLAWWCARRLSTDRPDLRIGAGIALLGVLAQIVVGGLTVRLKLPPAIVSSHFLISMVILCAASFTWYAARREQPVRLGAADRVTRVLSIALLAVAAAVIVAGVMTTAGGPHSGAAAGQTVERLSSGDLAVIVHARGAYVFAALLVALVLWRRRSRAGTREVLLVTVLVAVQIALGEIQYRNGLPWGVVLAHVGNAALLWIVTCCAAWSFLERPADPHEITRSEPIGTVST